MNRLFGWGGVLAVQLFAATSLRAGGSELNVVIVVNQSSSNSVQLGNYYRERRQVPPQNVLRVNWSGGNVEWAESDLENTILNPLLTMLSARQLTNQIDYVVLSMDFPYRVTSGSSKPNSTTTSLFYGFKADTNPPTICSLADGSANMYFASEGIFRATPPISASSNSFLVTMITGTNLALAKQVVDQGVLGDATFPTQMVLLGKSFDTARNVRYLEFDNTVFDTRLRGNYSVLRTNINEPGAAVNLLGYENGIVAAGIAANAFVAGSMADNLTSFSGDLFENTGHTTALDFLHGGASGSYGTVTEPCNYLEKFPSSENYFYQARGFNLAECYYQSLANPYQGIIVAEPLSAPFAQPANASWTRLTANAILSGTTNLSLQFAAADAQHPVQQVDLFLDGLWLQTVTNIAPHQNNVLNVTLNGNHTSYTVPAGATVKSVTSGLAAMLNNLIYTNLTKVLATPFGDRIELQSTDGSKTGSQVTLSASNSVAGPPVTTFVAASRGSFLDSIAWGYRSYEIIGTPGTNDSLRITITKTNNTQVSLAVTNSSGGSLTLLVQSLLNLINANAGLQGTDGLAGEDFQMFAADTVVFNLRALGQGYAAAQIQANLTSSLGLSVNPAGNGTLTANLGDLEPRNHLYVTAGATNLTFSFPLNTASLPDGYHELAAVAYEGSHVRTQARATQQIVIQNTMLSATLTALVGGSNTAVEATLQFSVSANTPNVSRIELFSTAGTIGLATNQSSATFSIAGTNLDLGLHPFYAVVTGTTGQQYRTATLWFRLIGPEPPFALQVNALPTTLTWLATAGRSYVIQATTNLAVPFQLRDSIVPTNSMVQWSDTNSNSTQLFYRVVAEP